MEQERRAVDDGEADAYLAEKTSEQPLVIADAQTAADHHAQHLIEINGKTYAEDDSLTAEYAGRDGVRGWFRGFGVSQLIATVNQTRFITPMAFPPAAELWALMSHSVSHSNLARMPATAISTCGRAVVWKALAVAGMLMAGAAASRLITGQITSMCRA